jgi:hypothetical protein
VEPRIEPTVEEPVANTDAAAIGAGNAVRPAPQRTPGTERKKRRDERQSRKPFKWKEGTNVKKAFKPEKAAKSGMLDFANRTPDKDGYLVSSQPINILGVSLAVNEKRNQIYSEAHHVWPWRQFGGPEDQALLGVIYTIHRSILHEGILILFSIAFPQFGPMTWGANAKLIAHFKSSPAARFTAFALLLAFYQGIAELSDPKMPPEAYETGLLQSLEHLNK